MTSGYLKDIADLRPRNARLMGLDVGAKTIGIALCDPAQSLATPLQTIQRTKFTKDIKLLAEIVADYEVEGFVIGLPLHMNDSEGCRAQSVKDFVLELLRYPEVVGAQPWVAFWDERLSTVSAENLVDGSVSKRKAKASGVIDKLAACIILQSALDYIGNL
ncbi:MAG: Holliday junction resolvase RuvX [Alphaproteobacteria bacterium]